MAEKRRAAKPGGVKAHPKPEPKKKPAGGREPVREEKIDRNAPCPCGSGKKYKKCCAETPGFWVKLKRFLARKKSGEQEGTPG